MAVRRLAARRLPKLGLGAKLAAFTGLLLAMSTAAVVFANALAEEARLGGRLRERGAELAGLLASLAAGYHHDLRIDELRTALDDAVAGSGLLYAFVLDGGDAVLVEGAAATDRLFEVVDDPLGRDARDAGAARFALDDRGLHVAGPVPFGDGEVGVVRLGLPLDGLRADVAALRNRNVALGTIVCGIGLALSLALARRVTRPLVELTAVTEAVANGDFSRRVAAVRASDEVGLLAASFDRMVARLEASADHIHQLAYFDGLTGLPNRVLFRDRLGQALERASREGESVAVICLDLDRFKEVNDTLGHAAGDLLLRAAAERLRACLRASDTLARLGGDEFAVVQAGLHQPDGADVLARRLVDALGRPFDLDGHEATVGTSLGAAVFPADGADVEVLLKNADLALYRAKAEGRGAHRFFEEGMDLRLRARKAMEQDLRRAVAAGQLELYYQPQVGLGCGRVVGVEALLRWHHPERGMVPPADFIPLAEETGLIGPIGEWVLRTACAEAAAWRPLRIAVNLSPAQFRQANLAATVAAILEETGFEPDRLELEITEGVLLQDTDATVATLEALKRLGARIAMDDFGTGYSSLSYLRRFPFDKIKIDRSFVSGLGSDPEAAAIVQAVVTLGRSLGMKANAEGVETAEQAALLRAQGCEEVQGYHFGRPMPAHALAELIGASPVGAAA